MEENSQEKLINKKENGWETIDEETKKKIFVMNNWTSFVYMQN